MKGGAPTEKILEIYNDVCKLAVLSGLEIDKAKRAYDNVNVGKELSALHKKYNRPAPIFLRKSTIREKKTSILFMIRRWIIFIKPLKSLTS